MMCPHCGLEITEISPRANSERYINAVNERLEQYGYPKGMSPEKYQAGLAVRRIMKIRFGFQTKASGLMDTIIADAAIKALDEVLPNKEAQHDNADHSSNQ